MLIDEEVGARQRLAAEVTESCFKSIYEVLLIKIFGWKVRGVRPPSDESLFVAPLLLSSSSSMGRLIFESKLSLWLLLLRLRSIDLYCL